MVTQPCGVCAVCGAPILFLIVLLADSLFSAEAYVENIFASSFNTPSPLLLFAVFMACSGKFEEGSKRGKRAVSQLRVFELTWLCLYFRPSMQQSTLAFSGGKLHHYNLLCL